MKISTTASGSDEIHLRPCFEKLAVLATPGHAVALRQFHHFVDGRLAIADGALQIAALDAVLHADVARIVFAVNEGRAVALGDVRELAERNLLPIGCADQQVPDLLCAAAELRLHAHDQVEQLFPLNDLSDRLPADSGRNYGLDVGDIDSVSRDFVAVDVHEQAGLPQFAHHGEFRKAGHFGQGVLDLDRFILKHIQVVAVDFDGERTLEASQGFVNRIFCRLCVVEDNSGEGDEFLVDGFDQLLLVADISRSTPYPCTISGPHRTRS